MAGASDQILPQTCQWRFLGVESSRRLRHRSRATPSVVFQASTSTASGSFDSPSDRHLDIVSYASWLVARLSRAIHAGL